MVAKGKHSRRGETVKVDFDFVFSEPTLGLPFPHILRLWNKIKMLTPFRSPQVKGRGCLRLKGSSRLPLLLKPDFQGERINPQYAACFLDVGGNKRRG